MPKLRTLSGNDLLRIFSQFGFAKYSQRGSHVTLRRVLSDRTRQTLTIVAHKEVDKGTCKPFFVKLFATSRNPIWLRTFSRTNLRCHRPPKA